MLRSGHEADRFSGPSKGRSYGRSRETMRKCVLALAMGLLVMGGLGQARAQSGWSQRFKEGGCSNSNGPFNVMVVTMDSECDAAFAVPAFTLFTDADSKPMNWTVDTAGDQKSATATLLGGSPVDYVQFNLNFARERASSLKFTFDAYKCNANNGRDLVDHANATWDGNKWTITPQDFNVIAAPEASSLALLLPGLLPVAYFLRRRKA
jgi:hypothetical protein